MYKHEVFARIHEIDLVHLLLCRQRMRAKFCSVLYLNQKKMSYHTHKRSSGLFLERRDVPPLDKQEYYTLAKLAYSRKFKYMNRVDLRMQLLPLRWYLLI